MTKRAVLYCRVSTDDQNLDTQLLDLREFARQRGFDIVGEYTDVISFRKAAIQTDHELGKRQQQGHIQLTW